MLLFILREAPFLLISFKILLLFRSLLLENSTRYKILFINKRVKTKIIFSLDVSVPRNVYVLDTPITLDALRDLGVFSTLPGMVNESRLGRSGTFSSKSWQPIRRTSSCPVIGAGRGISPFA